MINVVLILFQDIIEEVEAFKNEADAKAFFERHTGVNFDVFKQRVQDEDTETIFGVYAGSNIWGIELK